MALFSMITSQTAHTYDFAFSSLNSFKQYLKCIDPLLLDLELTVSVIVHTSWIIASSTFVQGFLLGRQVPYHGSVL